MLKLVVLLLACLLLLGCTGQPQNEQQVNSRQEPSQESPPQPPGKESSATPRNNCPRSDVTEPYTYCSSDAKTIDVCSYDASTNSFNPSVLNSCPDGKLCAQIDEKHADCAPACAGECTLGEKQACTKWDNRDADRNQRFYRCEKNKAPDSLGRENKCNGVVPAGVNVENCSCVSREGTSTLFGEPPSGLPQGDGCPAP